MLAHLSHIANESPLVYARVLDALTAGTQQVGKPLGVLDLAQMEDASVADVRGAFAALAACGAIQQVHGTDGYLPTRQVAQG